jgi:hypothetical protein
MYCKIAFYVKDGIVEDIITLQKQRYPLNKILLNSNLY